MGTAPHLDIVDPAFNALILPDAPLVKLFDQGKWTEGPVWFADGGYLVFSDIPNNRMLRYLPGQGISTFRSPSNFVNGNTRDLQGRLISCSHGGRCVYRTEYDGTLTTLVDSYGGKRLNSPNDVVVKSDGTIWFTDPTYGILSDYEGYQADSEQPECYVFRFDPADGSLTVVADGFEKPNGLAFSPDEQTLYISDTGRSHRPDWPTQMRKYDVVDGKTLSNGRVFIDLDSGASDGFRLDQQGNVWTSAGPNVNVYNPAGVLLGRVILGTPTSNVTFGGPKRSTLFITSSQFLYSLEVAAIGLQRP